MDISKIYFDMDGVLADFDRGVTELCNFPYIPQDKKTPEQDDEMWAAIRKVEHFYFKLEPMEGALEMFAKIYEKYGSRCEILTGIPKPKRGIATAGEDKTEWVHKYLSPDIVVNIVYAQDKKNFCKGKDYVLIDDLKKNTDVWINSGGTGILHRSVENTMEILGM